MSPTQIEVAKRLEDTYFRTRELARHMVEEPPTEKEDDLLKCMDGYNPEEVPALDVMKSDGVDVSFQVSPTGYFQRPLKKTDGEGDGDAPQEGQGSEEIVALDAVALYPSISREVAMEMCKQAALETEIEIKNMNLLEATRLLVLMWSEEKIAKSSIQRFLPVRRREPGKKIGKLGLTTENSFSAVPNNKDQ